MDLLSVARNIFRPSAFSFLPFPMLSLGSVRNS